LAESNQRRCIPITLSPKTIALGHESLTRKTRQLLQTVQVLKSCRESTEASLFKEPSHGNLLARCAVEALSMLPVFLDRGGEDIAFLVLFNEPFHLVFCDFSNQEGKIPDAVSVDRPSKLDLGFYSIAAGHGDLAHIHAAETCDLQVTRLVHCQRASRPAC